MRSIIQEKITDGRLIYAAVGAACILIWSAIVGWPGQMTAVAYDQEKLDAVVAKPSPNNTFEFQFTPTRDGLSSVEVIVVNTQLEDQDVAATAVLMLSDASGQVIASKRLSTSGTKHNTPIRLNFEPISNSSGKTLFLTMSGGEGNGLSLWGYSVNVWPNSQLSNGGDAQTLRMTTRYVYQWSSTWFILSSMTGRFGLIVLVLLLYIPMPAAVFLAFFSDDQWESETQLAATFALGVSIWPLFWMWLTVVKFSFSGPILWGVLAIGWGAVIFKKIQSGEYRSPSLNYVFLLIFLAVIFSLRLLAIRDQAFLPWVDSSRHALITAIMRDNGQFLSTYEPYLPVSWSGYHYGFHTLSAGVSLLLGDRVQLPDLLLVTMQLLSTLVCLAVYAGSQLLTRSRTASWVAMFMVGLPFLFPAYYTTWGRLTQISGMLVLPVLIGLLVKLSWADKRNTNLILVLALLTAGLFLLHARLFFYFIPFGLVLTVFYAAAWLGDGARNWSWKNVYRGPVLQLAIVGLISGILVVPRIWRLLNETTYIGVGVVATEVDRPLLQFPIQYVNVGWEFWFWILAAGSIILSVLYYKLNPAAVWWLKITGLLFGWLGLLYLMTAGPSLHPNWPILLPQSSINSAYIASFAAEAILIGISTVLGFKIANHYHRLAGFIVTALIGAGLMASTLYGIKNQIVILNRVTILGKPAELAAIEWIGSNTPANAKIANNAWPWLNGTWAGTDASGWITPVTGRLTGTPPIDHIYNSRLFGITSAFNDSARAFEDWSQPEPIALLRANGFTHIYIGINDGSGGVNMDPADLLQNREVKTVYDQDGVFIFEILPKS
ncbi:MAG: hypothetical protein AAGD96_08480 [Chloroflexota bacterium]